jgi:hypothetical protein
MRRKAVLQIFAMTALMGFALACAENPTAPSVDSLVTANQAYLFAPSTSDGSGGDGSTGGESTPTLVRWQTPLASDVSASQFCQAMKRCSVELQDVNVFVTIPRGALTQDATISVTALAGEFVNFQFGPHGTQFAKNIKVSVSTADTNVSGKQELTALYWIYDANGDPVVQEEIPAVVWKGRINFSPDHFSGYALAM